MLRQRPQSGVCLVLSILSNVCALDGIWTPDWNALKRQVQGRLYTTTPFSQPCFDNYASSDCQDLLQEYSTGDARTNYPSAYIQTQWESCQSTSEQCLLDPTNPGSNNGQCLMGSIPPRYIDVRQPNDIIATFKFSEKTNIPLVVKNTGHDYLGRSSAPGSLALWTHNLKNISYDAAFEPKGCTKPPMPAITVGAGIQWFETYEFAENHNITVVGGSDRTVGVVGWLLGGGHGMLSPTMGLGVDRALQLKVVTPDGHYRVVNECQDPDLFFALRGGGGTFGVVVEATMMVSPPVALQTVILQFSPNTTLSRELWGILVDNGLQWSKDGWGGVSIANVAVFINPILRKEAAASSAAPLIEFGQRLKAEGASGVSLTVVEFPSWYKFFQPFAKQFAAKTGASFALASRLIDKSSFSGQNQRSGLVEGLLAADKATPGVIIHITPPSSAPSTNKTSVTEAWQDSLYHVTLISSWAWNTTKAEKAQKYKDASSSIDHLRRLTPDAAYFNEADVYEPNFQKAFWGMHYPQLERIKRKYDPQQLLDCWHCVNWNRKSPRFRCYL
ncbi:FAD binding domain-containing protein [Crepidotus variabilis]|uniref:FAD binding domain-containing protein n=1 Tax=Crepidotus variabilis TaxID=179855 RepID=A0A9P6JM43_9AGAR|nr:FAD binding domain-containing protein [Crepidotus variabilis]